MSKDRRFGTWLFISSSLAALALRLVYMFQVRDATLFKAPLRDSAFYVARAWEIVQGDIIGRAVSFHSAPIYPYFIAAIMGIMGEDQSLWWLRLTQALVSAITVGLLSLTALRLFGRWAGVATALLALLYGPFLFYSGEILEITLTLFFLACGFLILARDEDPGFKRLLAVGALLGLAALGKPNLLVLAPLLWISVGLYRSDDSARPWAWRKGLLLAAGFLIVILPFTLRNKLAGDDWVLISSNGGINLFIGNNPDASGGFQVPEALATNLEGGSRQVAESAKGRPLMPSEVSRFWIDRSLAYFTGYPGDAAELWLRKTGLLLNHYEIPNHYNYYFFREYYAPILRGPLVAYSMVLPLGLLGLVFGARRNRRTRRQAWSILAVALTVILFFVTSRYRLPMVALLFPFAGFGLALLGQTLHARRWKLLSIAMGVLIIGLVLVRLPLIGQTHFEEEFNALSNFWFSQKDYSQAAFYSTEAIRQNDQSAAAWQNLGFAYLEQGDFVRAENCLWAAIALDPNFGYAYGNLAKLYFDYSRPILAQKCIDKVERLAPELMERLAEVHTMIPLLNSDWEERAQRLLDDLDEKEAGNPGLPRHKAERAQIVGLRLEKHTEALAILDEIPQAAIEADSSLAEYVKFMRGRLTVVRDHMRFLD